MYKSACLCFFAIALEVPMMAFAYEPHHVNSIGMEFNLIPAGSFLMGSTDSEAQAANDEKPRHEVVISKPFYLARHEVTQAQWETVMGYDPYSLERTNPSWEPLLRKPSRFRSPGHPATMSWNDAQEFINRLNQLEGKTKYRLPTEAEWEYAVRAGSETAYSFGDDISDLHLYAWYGADFQTGSTHPVGQKKPNAWGLYDMHGNVWEWTLDWYDDDYYAISPPVDPTGPKAGSQKVVRGGSWHQTADSWRSAFRRSYPPDYRGISIGFRLVLEVE